MAKANSFKAEPWTAIDKGAWGIFQDDFISDKLTCKFNKKSATSGVQFKQSFSLNQQSKVNKYSDELKLWFPYQQNTIYFRLKSNTWKLHADFGLTEKNGSLWNLYSSVQGGRDLGSETIKLGLQFSQKNWSNNLRVAFKPSVHGFTLYHKASLSQGFWRLWKVNAFNPIEKAWVYSAFQIAHVQDCSSFYLRSSASNKWNAPIAPTDFLSNLTVDYIHNYSTNTKLGAEVSADLSQLKVKNASLIWDNVCATKRNTAFKLRADLNRTLAVAIKNNIEGYGSYTFGVNVNDFGQANKFSYGVQLELNL